MRISARDCPRRPRRGRWYVGASLGSATETCDAQEDGTCRSSAIERATTTPRLTTAAVTRPPPRSKFIGPPGAVKPRWPKMVMVRSLARRWRRHSRSQATVGDRRAAASRGGRSAHQCERGEQEPESDMATVLAEPSHDRRSSLPTEPLNAAWRGFDHTPASHPKMTRSARARICVGESEGSHGRTARQHHLRL